MKLRFPCSTGMDGTERLAGVLRTILLLTKGVIRNAHLRRTVMFWVILAALIMLFLGSVFLSDAWVRAHPFTAIAYWLLCLWLTLAGTLLAIFEILLLRATQRAARRALEKQLMDEQMRVERERDEK